MPAVIEELLFGRREVIGKSAEVPYAVTGAEDEDDVRTVADANIPGSFSSDGTTLYLREVEIAESIDETSWKLRARYRKSDWRWSASVAPDSRFAFDTSGGSQHITNSRETVNSYGPKRSTEFGGAIGFDGKTVKGCDIIVPIYNFSETHYFDDDDVTSAYKQTLFGLTGKTNNGSFKGFSEGEVLFLGASGSRQGDDSNDLWEITFRFAASQNRTGITVGTITGIAKWGWEYMWVQYGDDEDTTAKVLVKKPVAVYIERVYDSGDFSGLDIGIT